MYETNVSRAEISNVGRLSICCFGYKPEHSCAIYIFSCRVGALDRAARALQSSFDMMKICFKKLQMVRKIRDKVIKTSLNYTSNGLRFSLEKPLLTMVQGS